ncbi:hypothetical protein CR205_05425 [Alteribacter lacisalsi]|uniref:Uncharacterized protein n=1 Tax=Alteribacter lacisalsi TaxID=2045244 RepID=A0A2W0HA72_9BACI|nr:hypothetical protein [Alteribacter lacisalsi]PYZ98037.1 hypothetical protein CR205_05425 [Alteribacter lacisalsi]
MVYFAVISLVLHSLSFYFIILLAKRNRDLPDEKARREIEDLLTACTEEMKQNNDELLDKLRTAGSGSENTAGNINEEKYSHAASERTAADGKGGAEASVSARSERVRILSGQGLSESEIAKEMGIGQGEVKLFLKFYN